MSIKIEAAKRLQADDSKLPGYLAKKAKEKDTKEKDTKEKTASVIEAATRLNSKA